MQKIRDLSPQNEKPENSALYILYGETGSGKSALLDEYIKKHPNEIALYRPTRKDSLLITEPGAYLRHKIIAIEELFQWKTESIIHGIREMERAAIIHRKRLIITIQNQYDLDILGITPKCIPIFIKADRNLTLESFEKILARHDQPSSS